MNRWLEEWKIGKFPNLPGLFYLADSERLEKIYYIGAAAKNIAEEAYQAECKFGPVLEAVSCFCPNYVQGYWPCPQDMAIVGQLPNLAAKLVEESQPLINLKATRQIKPSQPQPQTHEVELIQ